jgi:hypothetical protein
MGAIGPTRALERSREVQWPGIRADFDASHVAMVGLVRHTGINPFNLTQSHQVLGYAYEVAADAVTIRIYDPDWPDREDVTLTLGDLTIKQSTGEQLMGLIDLS